MKAKFLNAVLISGVLFVAASKSYAHNHPPYADLEAVPVYVVLGMSTSVTLDGSDSNDPDGRITKYEWDFDYNGSSFDCDYYETSSYHPDGAFNGITTHTYEGLVDYEVMLKVTDNRGATDTDTCTIYVRRIVNITQDSSDPNIQTAIDNASPGDTIIVAEGRYTDTGNRDIDFKGLGITIRSIDPNDPAVVAATIIDCNGTETEPNRGFYFHNSETANSVLAGFTITNGYATNGGGIYCESEPTITNCTITNNEAGEDGGGIYCYDSDPNIINCTITHNEAADKGGGIYFNQSEPNIINCNIMGNKACYGGGMHNKNSSPTVVNCVFSKNTTTYRGGGIANYNNSSPKVINCTFAGNYAAPWGGGMYNDSSSSPTLTNCIFWGNSAATVSDEWDQIYGGTPAVNYCCIQGLDMFTGNDNIGEDPKFVDAVDTDGSDGVFGTIDDGLYLRTDSPCIDTGNNSSIESEGIDTDIIGNARIVDGNHAQEDSIWATVDMGAYELPTIWYVDAYVVEGGDDNGTSWANAYDKLQNALNDTDIEDGNEIWVANGTYYPDQNSTCPEGTGLREETFQLVQGVVMYGGFSSGKTARIDRDWTLNETTLSGDIGTLDEQDDNSYHVVKGADDAILDGFKITGGNADGLGADGWGGGIYCSGVSPTISNCVIEDNNSSGDGGGMYNSSSSPTLINSIFSGNTANRGGGMFNINSSVTLTNCVFTANAADAFGGGVLNRGFSPTLINCTFSGNSTDGHGGGMCNVVRSNPTLTNCIFWGNHAGTSGDEITNSVDADATFSYCDVNGCGGSDNWDPSFGTDGGGNIDSDPCFVKPGIPAGPDGIFGTLDDGLRLTIDSNCIDAADGYAAPSTDILGFGRVNIFDVNNTGTGDPNYADIGAYEYACLKIVGGENHTMVRLADMTVWACGDNFYGQLGIGGGGAQWTLVQVHDGEKTTGSGYLENIAFLDAGWKHSLALDNDGNVWAWGKNSQGQLGDDESPVGGAPVTTPVQVEDTTGSSPLTGIVKVAAGRSGEYSLACDENKNAWAWGLNDLGQLGIGETGGYKNLPQKVVGEEGIGTDLQNVIGIDAGISHSIALDGQYGYVWCWGYNYWGQLGNGKSAVDYEPGSEYESLPVQVVGGLQDIVDVKVSCGLGGYGSSFAVGALANGGNVWAWGDNYFGQLGNNFDGRYQSTPVTVHAGEQNPADPGSPLKDIIAISAGDYHVLALDKEGNVWAWGYNEYGQLGNGEYKEKPTPVQVKIDSDTDLTNIVYIDAGMWHSTAIDKSGSFWVWGHNSVGKLGLGEGSESDYTYAQLMPGP